MNPQINAAINAVMTGENLDEWFERQPLDVAQTITRRDRLRTCVGRAREFRVRSRCLVGRVRSSRGTTAPHRRSLDDQIRAMDLPVRGAVLGKNSFFPDVALTQRCSLVHIHDVARLRPAWR